MTDRPILFSGEMVRAILVDSDGDEWTLDELSRADTLPEALLRAIADKTTPLDDK